MKKLESKGRNFKDKVTKTAVNKVRHIEKSLRLANSAHALLLRERLSLWKSKL